MHYRWRGSRLHKLTQISLLLAATMADVELGFTTDFLNNLQSQHATLSSWLDSETARVDSLVDEISNSHADEVERIDGLIRRLDDVRIQRGLASSTAEGGDGTGGVAQQKLDLKEKQSRLEAEVAERREQNRKGEACLNGMLPAASSSIDTSCSCISINLSSFSIARIELLQKQADQQAAALASRNKKMAIAEMKNTTLDDLTKGLINYKYLGLGFESVGKENSML